VNTVVITNKCESNIPSQKPEPSITSRTNNFIRTVKGLNETNKHKIMVIGDSHCRGTARNISDYLGGKFEVIGLTKPDAGALDIFAPINMNYSHLTKNDVIVIQGGYNDAYRYNQSQH
jgi:hypothetical protein